MEFILKNQVWAASLKAVYNWQYKALSWGIADTERLEFYSTMWQSEDDIAKDLAILSDFSESGDLEPHTFLHSVGSGLKVKGNQQFSKKFIDSRTGEVIDVDDRVLDAAEIFHKSKGRGTLLSKCLRTNSQLQQQLRLARPLGSGDEAIESYCRRNISLDKPKNSLKISDPKPEVAVETHDLRFGNSRQRIKAIRNSSFQSNALISNLLSKAQANSETKLVSGCYKYYNNNNDNDEFK